VAARLDLKKSVSFQLLNCTYTIHSN